MLYYNNKINADKWKSTLSQSFNSGWMCVTNEKIKDETVGFPFSLVSYFLLFLISCAKVMAENTFATSAGRILRL